MQLNITYTYHSSQPFSHAASHPSFPWPVPVPHPHSEEVSHDDMQSAHVNTSSRLQHRCVRGAAALLHTHTHTHSTQLTQLYTVYTLTYTHTYSLSRTHTHARTHRALISCCKWVWVLWSCWKGNGLNCRPAADLWITPWPPPASVCVCVL